MPRWKDEWRREQTARRRYARNFPLEIRGQTLYGLTPIDEIIFEDYKPAKKKARRFDDALPKSFLKSFDED